MGAARKIMVADDDLAILDSISILLEFEGYEVQCVTNGAALLTMEEGFADLLLLDIWMSGTDGRDVCRELKRRPGTAEMPVIMISASKDIGPSALDAGADDFLAKPFEIDDLLRKIERCLA